MKKKALTVVVIGLGNFGFQVACSMAEMGHSVIAIDTDPERVQAIGDKVAKAAVADARKGEVLKSLGADQADLAIVSLGDRIDNSALATLQLKELGINEIRVKVISEEHAELMKRIGASDTVFPERDMAKRLAQRLSSPNIVERLSLSADFGILEYVVDPAMAGKNLIEMDLRRKFHLNVIGMKEKSSGNSYLNPDPTQPLTVGDILFILGNLEDLDLFQNRR